MLRLCGWATAVLQTIVFVFVCGSIAATVLLPKPATRTRRPSGVIARLCGMLPTSMLATTSSVAVLTTDTTASPSLLAYTRLPSGVITSPCGPAGMGIVVRTWLQAVSSTATLLSPNSPTYTFGKISSGNGESKECIGLAPVVGEG